MGPLNKCGEPNETELTAAHAHGLLYHIALFQARVLMFASQSAKVHTRVSLAVTSGTQAKVTVEIFGLDDSMFAPPSAHDNLSAQPHMLLFEVGAFAFWGGGCGIVAPACRGTSAAGSSSASTALCCRDRLFLRGVAVGRGQINCPARVARCAPCPRPGLRAASMSKRLPCNACMCCAESVLPQRRRKEQRRPPQAPLGLEGVQEAVCQQAASVGIGTGTDGHGCEQGPGPRGRRLSGGAARLQAHDIPAPIDAVDGAIGAERC